VIFAPCPTRVISPSKRTLFSLPYFGISLTLSLACLIPLPRKETPVT
jgi:hypothetical protein